MIDFDQTSPIHIKITGPNEFEVVSGNRRFIALIGSSGKATCMDVKTQKLYEVVAEEQGFTLRKQASNDA